MINIRTLERLVTENDLNIQIVKRDITPKDIDYHMGYGRQYDVSGYSYTKLEELILINCPEQDFFFQDIYIGSLLTLTE